MVFWHIFGGTSLLEEDHSPCYRFQAGHRPYTLWNKESRGCLWVQAGRSPSLLEAGRAKGMFEDWK